jgi:putative DNA primase/helicase
MAKETARLIYKEASEVDDVEQSRKLASHAIYSQSCHGLKSMIELAKTEEKITILPFKFDSDPFLLNVMNGSINLKTGELNFQRPEDYITKLCAVTYDKDAECPNWINFLDTIFAGNEDLILYVQQVLGYCLTGDVSEQCLFFLYGAGKNGKTTLIRVMQELLGDYAGQLTPNFLMMKRYESHPTEIADLYRVRFVGSIEPDKGCQLSEAFVKWITGSDRLKARRMREDFWEFDPTHKIFLAANEKPKITGVDDGIWRRIKLIPCTVHIENPDKNIMEKLRPEFPGILNWAIEGCLKWRQSGKGLVVPSEVETATKDYREQMDSVIQFVGDECIVKPGTDLKVKGEQFYTEYEFYCQDQDLYAVSRNEFTKRLETMGIEHRRSTGGYMHYLGIDKKPKKQSTTRPASDGVTGSDASCPLN